MSAPTLLLVGCGDIGTCLGLRFAAQEGRVVGLRRNTAALPAAIEPLAADVLSGEGLDALHAIAPDYVVITLTPAAHDEAGYRAIFVEGLQRVLQQLSTRHLKRLLFASSTGVYHQSGGSVVDEGSATEPKNYSGQAVLAAEQVLRDSGLPVTLLRFGGIYGPGREQLIRRVREGRCAPETPVHYSNRIHRDDCVNVLEFLIRREEAGAPVADCYVAVDDAPAPLAEVHRWLAAELGVEYRCESGAVERAGSKRCSNALLRSTGFEFQYPDYRSGYRAVLGGMRDARRQT